MLRFEVPLILSSLLLLSGCVSAAPPAQAPAAPPRKCEIRQSAWCIDQGAFEITDRLAQDSVHDRVWTLRGPFRPESKLVILEPNGCRSGFAETPVLSSYEQKVVWEGRSWDRIRARLKSDGSCDLEVLIPPFDGDPMEWAFSTGLMLVKACKDEACSGESLAELKPRFEKRFREGH
jgi:hypothetical protein